MSMSFKPMEVKGRITRPLGYAFTTAEEVWPDGQSIRDYTFEEARAYVDGLLAMEAKSDEEAFLISYRNDSYGY